MNIESLKSNLVYLINRYIPTENERKELLGLVSAGEDIPVIGILADLTPYLSMSITADDEKILKEIVFFYC